ncbi:MAG TPA: PDZ domain-containing protein [Methylophilaceae bacterium]|nr:PDZ domain-containing protein [Methylophilaceae bacterium]
MSPFVPLMLASLLALQTAGCANAKEPKPREAPVDMNLADDGTPAAENLFAKSFVKRDLPSVALQPDTEGPKVYRGEDRTTDYQSMLENGYDMLGYSEFLAGENVSPISLEEHAKQVKADVALVYTRHAGEVPASVQVQQLREQAKKGERPDTSQAESKDTYNYYASYWAKLRPPLLGVHVMGPAEDKDTDGLRVIAVIHESPADKAGIKVGDVLKRLGDVVLKSPSALTQAAQRYAGQKADVDLQRGQQLMHIPVQLNARSNTARR